MAKAHLDKGERQTMKRSQEDKIAEAVADMPKWRAKTARSLLGYALLIAFLTAVLVAETWLFRHKIISKFSTRPVMSLLMLGGTIYAVVACVGVVRTLFSARRSMLEHNRRVTELEAAPHTPEA